MPAQAWLRAHDLDAALTLVGEVFAADGEIPEPFPLAVVERLQALVGADRAGYFEYAAGGLAFGEPRTIAVEAPAPTRSFGWDDEAVTACMGHWPLADTLRKHERTPLFFSDFVTARARPRDVWYAEVMRPRGIEHECKLWLGGAPWAAQGFFFVRSPNSRDFSERERTLLTVLRPHLAAARERWLRRRPSRLLTPRESEALALARDGLTNKEIAQRLGITPGTVRSHFEHAFEKLGAHTRTAAINRAFGPRPR